MWMTRWMKALVSNYNLFAVDFQQCMQGGKRDKWSTFVTNMPELRVLQSTCDGQHQHAPWGVTLEGHKYRFNTAEEAEYPALLCSRIAEAISTAAMAAGVQPCNSTPSKKRKAPDSTMMASAGKQPRGNRHPELIPEFQQLLEVPWKFPMSLPRKLTTTELDHYGLTSCAKLLSCVRGVAGKDDSSLVAKIGVYRSPQAFVEAAMELQHPFDNSSTLADDLKANIFALLTEGPDKVNGYREKNFTYYERRRQQLEVREREVHNALPEHREKVVQGKQSFLFQELCEDAGIHGENLGRLLLGGASLTGHSGRSGMFEDEDNEPAISVLQLMKSSRWSRRMLLGRGSQSAEDEEVSQAIWDVTLEEVSKGWLQGPYNEEQIRELCGPLFVASPRFGLVQADKVRPIDDMSIRLVNAAFASDFKLNLDGVDGIAVLARSFLESVKEDGTVEIVLSSGKQLVGKLRESLDLNSARRLVGRTLDLEAAYKQMMVSEPSLWCSVLLVSDPLGNKHYFLSQVLPFGAASSVYQFNKIARAIHLIGARLFGLLWCNYIDDYPQLDLEICGDAAQLAAERLLRLLGWKFSMKESKRQSMSRSFSALGVDFDFAKSEQGVVLVRNKQARVEQLVSQIEFIEAEGTLTSAAASSLRGRLQFAESQTFGRILGLKMRSCNSRASGALAGNFLTGDMLQELKWAKAFVRNAVPRVLQAGMRFERLLIFTDAALEQLDECGSVGMVAFSMHKICAAGRWFFSEKAPDSVMKFCQEKSRKVIAALELMAAVLAVFQLQSQASGRRIFLFVDNEAARASLIAMYSPILVHARLLSKLSEIVTSRSMFTWVSRVPSSSNPADEPSRLHVRKLEESGFTRVHPRWSDVV